VSSVFIDTTEPVQHQLFHLASFSQALLNTMGGAVPGYLSFQDDVAFVMVFRCGADFQSGFMEPLGLPCPSTNWTGISVVCFVSLIPTIYCGDDRTLLLTRLSFSIWFAQ